MIHKCSGHHSYDTQTTLQVAMRQAITRARVGQINMKVLTLILVDPKCGIIFMRY